jgi:hypothetical protein
LPLLVPRVLADDADDIFALHDAAAFAEAFDGGSDFHGWIFGAEIWRTKNRAEDADIFSAIDDFTTSAGR